MQEIIYKDYGSPRSLLKFMSSYFTHLSKIGIKRITLPLKFDSEEDVKFLAKYKKNNIV